MQINDKVKDVIPKNARVGVITACIYEVTYPEGKKCYYRAERLVVAKQKEEEGQDA